MNAYQTQTTYSFLDLVGSIVTAFGDMIPLNGGNIGFGRIAITMATERTTHDTGADGTVMPSYVAGASGTITMEMQQTSSLHHELLDIYNNVVTAADGGDVSSWAGMTISFRTVLDGSTHVLSGVSFSKIPDKPYASQGEKVTWSLMACNIQNY